MRDKVFGAGHFVNPFTDLGFKIIFGQPASKDLLITLLNELLVGEHRIEDLTLLDKEDHADNVSDAGIIYDLYCLTSKGEYIIVEMQNRSHNNFIDRTLYYMCRAIGRQVNNISEKRKKEIELRLGQKADELQNGDDVFMLREQKIDKYGSKYKLSTVYGVFLMNFKEPILKERFRTDTVIADRETGEVINPHFRQIYLQFPYFNKELEECETLYDKLIYALKNMRYWSRMPDALKEQVFYRLGELAAVANLSEEDRLAYDKAMDRYWVNRIVEEDVRNESWEKGLEEGRAKGIEQGREEGRAEGRAEGLEEGTVKTQKSIALNMKNIGMPTEQISRITGLSESEIMEL